MSPLLNHLKGNLIVSCQPVTGGALDHPEIIAGFAKAAIDGGACGLRIEGVANLQAVRRVTDVPVIGLVKEDRPDTAVRITSTLDAVRDLARGGADIIAIDMTDRDRPVPLRSLVEEIHRAGRLAMADCAEIEDAVRAKKLGCEILASTMSGYVAGPVPSEPDLDFVRKLAGLDGFVIAEGRYHSPADAARAMEAGADAVVVGSAITRPEHITSWFVSAVKGASSARMAI
ncbi:N-acetylmannosamine-6-phosphate 2-epimerase [Roseibium sediminis]|uniref:N-acetylmannosamine-6-phosphate 2-epimerase n=1 Tax=Roseibium sediminis TaxID=1775174 RepID=UPI001956D448|nr:putative N-acetylmannosamine-6-phosphate 2-epimerase [Roseibium sediminis]